MDIKNTDPNFSQWYKVKDKRQRAEIEIYEILLKHTIFFFYCKAGDH